ncbi:hypothetical protein FUAX_29500 [Fulvitalea axinellae]|uniref:Uncharacterized protein n=1 Tax=Fulvitalea axinellae TaxID=1182444 RepID=A0AAU9CQZ8_9BACT|nr:hypothetical protein FUAX_29500 [Fulvitalea axinellae]
MRFEFGQRVCKVPGRHALTVSEGLSKNRITAIASARILDVVWILMQLLVVKSEFSGNGKINFCVRYMIHVIR